SQMRGVAEKFPRHQFIFDVGAGDSINSWVRLQHLKLPAERLNLGLARILAVVNLQPDHRRNPDIEKPRFFIPPKTRRFDDGADAFALVEIGAGNRAVQINARTRRAWNSR